MTFGSVGRSETPGLAIKRIELTHDGSGLLQHLLCRLDRGKKRIEVERRNMFRCRHRHHLIVDQAEEILNHLQLRFDALHTSLDIVKRLKSSTEDGDVLFVERLRRLISELRRTLSLTELILDCLPVYRPQMILAPAILVKQIYKRLPCRLQFADLRWCF